MRVCKTKPSYKSRQLGTPIASPSTISLAFPPLTAPPSTRTDGCCPLPHSGNPADNARGNFSRSVNNHWGGMRDLQGLRLYRYKSLAPWGKDSHPTEMGRTWRSWREKEGCYNYHLRPKVSSRSGSVAARICANWCFFLPDSFWWEDWGLMTFLVSDEYLTELTPRYGSFIYYVGDINPSPTGKIRTDAWEGGQDVLWTSSLWDPFSILFWTQEADWMISSPEFWLISSMETMTEN